MFIKSLNCPNATMRYKFNEAFRIPRTCSNFFADLHFNEKNYNFEKRTSVDVGPLWRVVRKEKRLKIIVVRYTLPEGLQFIVLKLKIMDTD